MEELRPFEEAIKLEFVGRERPSYPGSGKRAPRKGIWINGHLQDVGMDYPLRMWHRWKQFITILSYQTERRTGLMNPGTYTSFYKFIYLLKKLNLIQEVAREPMWKGFERVYYRIVPGKEKITDEWERPFQTLYPVTDWMKLSKEQRSRLSRKYKQPSPRPRGRPRKI